MKEDGKIVANYKGGVGNSRGEKESRVFSTNGERGNKCVYIL